MDCLITPERFSIVSSLVLLRSNGVWKPTLFLKELICILYIRN